MNGEGLTKQAYKAIKNDIITGALKPEQSINEYEVQQRLNLGRTPVREALQILAKENLVTIYPRKGIIVTPISPKRIKDIFELRELIEPQILMDAGHLLNKAWLTGMLMQFSDNDKQNSADKDIAHYARLDDEFHSTIIKALGNQLVESMMENIFDYLTMIRLATISSPGWYTVNNEAHIEIIQLILDGKLKQASSSLKKHISKSYKFTINFYSSL